MVTSLVLKAFASDTGWCTTARSTVLLRIGTAVRGIFCARFSSIGTLVLVCFETAELDVRETTDKKK